MLKNIVCIVDDAPQSDQFGRLDFSDANLNHSIIQDCETDFPHMDRTMLDEACFYRIKHQAVTRQETVRMALIGGKKRKREV